MNIISSGKIPHTGNTRPSCTCVIKEYRYYGISLIKYHGWCQYHKSMSIGSKTVFKKGQQRSSTVNMVKKRSIWSTTDKNRSIWSKPDETGQKRSKMVKNGQKRSKTVTKLSKR